MTAVGKSISHPIQTLQVRSVSIIIIINTHGQIENRPIEDTRFAGRKWLLAGC